MLENGGSSVTRNAAAQQVGDIVKSRSVDVKPLLDRVLVLLLSKCWDTRVAAASALGAILNHVPKCKPKEASGKPYFCL